MATLNCILNSQESSDDIRKRQEALDSHQYSTNGILRYEFVFGRGYVSSGGGNTTAEILEQITMPKGGRAIDLVYSRDTLLHFNTDEKRLLLKKAFSWLKPGGQLVITDYCCGPQELWDEEFKAYLKDRNYKLVQLEVYRQLLVDAGFNVVKAVNHTERWVKALDEESERLEAQKNDFMDLFTEEDFSALRGGWESKKERVKKGLQFWGLFIATKPTESN